MHWQNWLFLTFESLTIHLFFLDSVKQCYLQTKKLAVTSSERPHSITWLKQKRRRNRWASKQVSRRYVSKPRSFFIWWRKSYVTKLSQNSTVLYSTRGIFFVCNNEMCTNVCWLLKGVETGDSRIAIKIWLLTVDGLHALSSSSGQSLNVFRRHSETNILCSSNLTASSWDNISLSLILSGCLFFLDVFFPFFGIFVDGLISKQALTGLV